MIQYETGDAHSSVERMTGQNTDEYCFRILLERHESDDSLAHGNKVSQRSEEIDFWEKNVRDDDECADSTRFKRGRLTSPEIQKTKKVKEEVFSSSNSSHFQ